MRVAGFVAGLLAAFAAGAQPRVTVEVFGAVPGIAKTLSVAEFQTARVFLHSGIQVQWVNTYGDPGLSGPDVCTLTKKPACFVLMLRDEDRPPDTRGDIPLGFALLGIAQGNHAAVLYRSVEVLAARHDDVTDVTTVLAYVMAHELGHLLSGSARHTVGVMKSEWERYELKLMTERRLFFSRAQTEEFRRVLGQRVASAQREFAMR